MRVRVTQLDGRMPNLACMRLAAWHRARGDEVVYARSARPGLFERPYDRVYGSAVFSTTARKVAAFRREFPGALVGGTGVDAALTLEGAVPGIGEAADYADHPEVSYSLGFLQRGCRLRCGFCVVPRKEGRPRPNQTVAELWRGEPHPRHLHVLDNDFFGIPEWRRHVADINAGGFAVCLSQGVNVRLIDDEAAAALASMDCRDKDFVRRRLYTAWDSLGQERVFFDGIDRLEAAGIPPSRVMAYMLTGYAKGETMADVQHRFDRMVERGIKPYPMVYDPRRKDLKRFQRWAVRGIHKALPFERYDPSARGPMRPARARQRALDL